MANSILLAFPTAAKVSSTEFAVDRSALDLVSCSECELDESCYLLSSGFQV